MKFYESETKSGSNTENTFEYLKRKKKYHERAKILNEL